jgi:hypothetical protein
VPGRGRLGRAVNRGQPWSTLVNPTFLKKQKMWGLRCASIFARLRRDEPVRPLLEWWSEPHIGRLLSRPFREHGTRKSRGLADRNVCATSPMPGQLRTRFFHAARWRSQSNRIRPNQTDAVGEDEDEHEDENEGNLGRAPPWAERWRCSQRPNIGGAHRDAATGEIKAGRTW